MRWVGDAARSDGASQELKARESHMSALISPTILALDIPSRARRQGKEPT
jgi:hypothetical protein